MTPDARGVLGHCVALALSALALLSSSALGGPAIGQFEMKQVETERGELEFQSQNAISLGMPRRAYREVAPGEFVYDDNTLIRQRYALELEYSWTDRFRSRAGIEYEQERIDDPERFARRNDFDSLELAEIAGEAVVVLVPVQRDRAGLALLVEYEYALDRDEADALTYGPLIQYGNGPWGALANLYLVNFFGGERVERAGDRDRKMDFAYTAQIDYRFFGKSSLALEAYGTVDRLGSSGTRSEEAVLLGDHDQHRLGPVLYYAVGFGDTPTVFGLGLLAGLNDDTPDATLKFSLEIEF